MIANRSAYKLIEVEHKEVERVGFKGRKKG